MKMNRKVFLRRGSAFIIVMVLTGILMIAGISLTYLTSNAAFLSRKINTGARCLAIAEAGVADMLVKLTTNYTYWSNNRTNSESYEDGSFYVTNWADTNTGHVLITSTGTIGRDSRITVLELLGNLWEAYDRAIGVDGAIMCGGTLSLDSSALTINGDIICNSSITNKSGNPDINGVAYAAGSISGVAADGGNNPDSPPVPIPSYFPLSTWEDIAATNGQCYGAVGSTQAFSGAYVATGGVFYVRGSATFNNGSSVSGTIVVAANLTIQQTFNQWRSNTNFPGIVVGGNIWEDNRNNYDGTIWAGGNIEINNRRNFYNCSIIALGSVDVKNRGTVTPPGETQAWAPGDTNQGSPTLSLGGWLR